MLRRVEYAPGYVVTADDKIHDEIDREAIKMLKEWLNTPVKLNKPILNNERPLFNRRKTTKSNKRK